MLNQAGGHLETVSKLLKTFENPLKQTNLRDLHPDCSPVSANVSSSNYYYYLYLRAVCCGTRNDVYSST